MKGTIKILDGTGHTAVDYDTDNGIVQEAEAILVRASMNMSAVFDAKTKERVENPRHNPDAGTILEEHDELLVIPPMAGGQ